MNNKKVLFLLGDIWSMGKGRGMPSVFKVLQMAEQEFESTVFTIDKNNYNEELSTTKVYYFKNMEHNVKNRYLQYFLSRVNIIILNMKYIYKFMIIKKDFDLVYCSSSIPIYATYFIKKFYKIKTIHRIYGTFLYPNLNSKIDKIKKFEEVLSFKINADRYIITDDGTMGDKVAKHYDISQDKIYFLRNGVNQINSSVETIIDKFNLEKNKFYALCVSRLVGWKRVDRIIKAFNKIDDEQIVLLIIGDGGEIDNLKSMARNNNIHFLGSLVAEDVHGLMQNCDLFISMYDISNIGNPLLEALSYGMPIITYNSGNTEEVINGENGILINSENEDEIIDTLGNNIIKLSEDKYLRGYLSSNAIKYTDKHLYNWDKRIKLEMKIMQELINEK